MYLPQRQRGRPRHDRPAKDQGTQELQQKRKKLLSGGQEGNLYFAESLLGVLYAHKVISKPLYEAGRFFGELGYRYESCLGHTFRARASVLALKRGSSFKPCSSSFVDLQDRQQTKAWRKALKALKRAGPHPYKVVFKVVFYDQDLYTSPFPHSLGKEMDSLRQGLECLESYFKRELRGKEISL